ncbi:hypothetical protein MMC17_001376 [Xylographa soralifera]|nr:hypothetical protein [Xylographa soralifera]
MATSSEPEKRSDPAAALDFKIVKVRKPDGTVVKVKRPIKKDAAVASELKLAAPAPSTFTASNPARSEKPATKRALDSTLSPVSQQSTTVPLTGKDVTKAPLEATAQPPAGNSAVITTSPRASPPAVVKTAASEKPPVVSPAPQPTEKLLEETLAKNPAKNPSKPVQLAQHASSSYGLYRRIHKAHRHISNVTGAFYPDLANDDNNDDDDSSDNSDDSEENMSGRDDKDDDNSIHSAHDSDQETNDSDPNPNNDNNASNDQNQIDHAKGRVGSNSSGHHTSHPAKNTTTFTTRIFAAPAKLDVTVNEKDVHEEGHSTASKPKPKPRSFGRRTSLFAQVVVWTVMVTVPLLFIVLGILTAVVKGQPANSGLGAGIAQARTIGASLWPIAFAAILAQTLKMYASYKVERGMRLMTLEQLISSHSVASAIKQPFFLKTFNLLSVVLLGLWSLSPLAGQAMLRMSYIGTNGTSYSTYVEYLDVLSPAIAFEAAANGATYIANVNILYGSAIISTISSQQEPEDAWGNTKIPILEKIAADSTADSQGWYSASSNSAYSSLIGVPSYGLENVTGNSTFTLHSSYFNFDCPALTSSSLDTANASANAQGINLIPSGTGTLYMGFSTTPDMQRGYLAFVQNRMLNLDTTLYGSTICTFNRSNVEAMLSCIADDCTVTKVRYSGLNSMAPLPGLEFAAMLHPWVTFGTEGGQSGNPTPAELYISDPITAGVNDGTYNPDIFATVSVQDFTTRIAILFNSYFQSGIAPFVQTGTKDMDSEGVNDILTFANVTNTNQVYQISWGWLTLLLVSSVILLVAGVAGTIWDCQTIGPDILGFASSMVRNNKYVKVPDVGAALSGPQRARMLGDVKVMLQDVRAEADVGKIALGTISAQTQSLQRGRSYR